MTGIWLKTPERTWNLYQSNGVSACGMWELSFAQPPPAVTRVWSRSDRLCRGCLARAGDLVFPNAAGCVASSRGGFTGHKTRPRQHSVLPDVCGGGRRGSDVSPRAYRELLGTLVWLWSVDCCPEIRLSLAGALSTIQETDGEMVIPNAGFLGLMDVLVRLRARDDDRR